MPPHSRRDPLRIGIRLDRPQGADDDVMTDAPVLRMRQGAEASPRQTGATLRQKACARWRGAILAHRLARKRAGHEQIIGPHGRYRNAAR